MLASIVLNVMNEEKNIADLLDSLVVIQERPIEIIVVDAASKDRTREIVKEYAGKVSLHQAPHQARKAGGEHQLRRIQGEGRHHRVHRRRCIANPFWIKELREHPSWTGTASWWAGPSTSVLTPGRSLDRVELYHKGNDISYPSCNKAFSREALTKAGGFDTWFITAEDIDLNIRAVDAGYNIVYNPNAVIYHRHQGDSLPILQAGILERGGKQAAHHEAWQAVGQL